MRVLNENLLHICLPACWLFWGFLYVSYPGQMEKNRRGKSKVEKVGVKEPAPSVDIPFNPPSCDCVCCCTIYKHLHTGTYAYTHIVKK